MVRRDVRDTRLGGSSDALVPLGHEDTEAKAKGCPRYQAGAAVEAGAHASCPLLALPQMWAKPLGLQDRDGAAPR